MYSSVIKPKVDTIFNDLREKVSSTVAQSSSSNEALDKVTRLVSSELTTRSKSILSDMLFELSDKQMSTDFFSDISRQNKFFELNLRQEILNKYQFTPNAAVNYKEASRAVQALKVGGVTFVVGGVAEIGVILVAGLTLPSIVPVPICLLIVASIGAALADYWVIEPSRRKKALAQAFDNYLIEAKQQFLNWFDEVEKYFNLRVEEIKKTM